MHILFQCLVPVTMMMKKINRQNEVSFSVIGVIRELSSLRVGLSVSCPVNVIMSVTGLSYTFTSCISTPSLLSRDVTSYFQPCTFVRHVKSIVGFSSVYSVADASWSLTQRQSPIRSASCCGGTARRSVLLKNLLIEAKAVDRNGSCHSQFVHQIIITRSKIESSDI